MSKAPSLYQLTLDHLTEGLTETTPHGPESLVSPISNNSQSFDEVRGLASPCGSNNQTCRTTPNSPTSPGSPGSPAFTSLPPLPSPKSHGRSREGKNFFSNFKASKSSSRLPASPDIPLNTSLTTSFSPLPRAELQSPINARDRPYTAHANGHGHIDKSQESGPVLMNKRSRGRFHLLRTQSFLGDPSSRRTRSILPAVKMTPPDLPKYDGQAIPGRHGSHETIQSRPIIEESYSSSSPDSSSIQNRNGDGQHHRGIDSRNHLTKKDRSHSSSMTNLSASFREKTGGQLFSNIRNQSSKATDNLGKAGRSFFGKMKRSGSANDRDQYNDENYVCHIINLPLIEQTRTTRIAKRIDMSRDKTEFWMPALPWRCIDYLNAKGCEEEGLYRVPGSGREVKHWQRRFDIEHDIDLFEEPDLYDINIIGSMFKAWLRELPDELFPKSIQKQIADNCVGATTATQMFKDELSKLPPYNYYLLFAITCHLSQLHACVEKNKMNYNNLCICFQPCLKIDLFCFRILVTDWKNCWQGCWTEKEFLEKESFWDRQNALSGISGVAISDTPVEDASCSSDNATPASSLKSRTPDASKAIEKREKTEKPRPTMLHLHKAKNSTSIHTPPRDISTINTTSHTQTTSSELPPLKPLSPIGI